MASPELRQPSTPSIIDYWLLIIGYWVQVIRNTGQPFNSGRANMA
jgi:hypothetical protein